jgi:hypothetical protein
MKNMNRAKRRHQYKVRKAAIIRRYKASPCTVPEERFLHQMVDTSIWNNSARMYWYDHKKPNIRRSDDNFWFQLEENCLPVKWG